MQGSEDVEEAVIKPMQALYPPPHHLRRNPEALQLALNTYRRALRRFDRPVLTQAWQRVAEQNEYWTWPKLSDLVRACERCEREAHPPGIQSEGESWVEKATALADAYTRRFMEKSQTAQRARDEGWDGALKTYVREAAWVQAQYLVGSPHIGYSAADLFGYPGVSAAECREQADDFFEKAREQAARGHIRVQVPASMVEYWKRLSGNEKERIR